MAASTTSHHHHHRSTTKSSHKSFKSKHATKSELKDRTKGRVEKGSRKTKHQMIMSKFDKKNQAKQLRLNHQAKMYKSSSIFQGKDGVSRIVSVVPLCSNVDTEQVVNSILSYENIHNDDLSNDKVQDSLKFKSFTSCHKKYIERFKQHITFLPLKRHLWSILDGCKMSDYIIFVFDCNKEVDDFGEMVLRSIENQGMVTSFAIVQDLQSIDNSKKQNQILVSLKSYINYFIPTIEKISDIQSSNECSNLVRMLCSSIPKPIHWREQRSWMMIEEAEYDDKSNELIIAGNIRGKPLHVDRLISLGDFGDFQISRIENITSTKSKSKLKPDSMDIEMNNESTFLPTENQDTLEEFAPEDVIMEERLSYATTEKKGVLIDDHYYYSEEENEEDFKPKRLPRGTSNYQSAWYLDDMEDSGSDMEDVEDIPSVLNLHDYQASRSEFKYSNEIQMQEDVSDYPQSEKFQDLSPEQEIQQIEEFRKQKSNRKQEAEDDLKFPDEIELDPKVSAIERLSKYRGLKSLRSSPWNLDEDRLYEPDEIKRSLEISNFQSTKNKILKDSLIDGIEVGKKVKIYLKDISVEVIESLKKRHSPIAMYSLLKHEHKQTTVNYSITTSTDLKDSIKSKDSILVQCGFRRFIINPLFSTIGQSFNGIHKFQRFISTNQTSMCSFIGPLTWPTTPILYFSLTDNNNNISRQPKLIGTGTSLPTLQSKIIVKRITLTGHPFKIHKRHVTVRYMFWNSIDVNWFKALRLYTNKGKQGHIKESLGTHGYFKATFDGKIDSMDVVSTNLYKRCWPKSSKRYQEE